MCIVLRTILLSFYYSNGMFLLIILCLFLACKHIYRYRYVPRQMNCDFFLPHAVEMAMLLDAQKNHFKLHIYGLS